MSKRILLGGLAAVLMLAACEDPSATTTTTSISEPAEQETGNPYVPSPLSVSAIGRVEAAPDIAVVTGLIEIEDQNHNAAFARMAEIINGVQATADTAKTEMSYTDISSRDIWDEDCLKANQEAQIRHNEISSALHLNRNVRQRIKNLKQQNQVSQESFDTERLKRLAKIRKLRANRDIPEFRRELFEEEEALEDFKSRFEQGQKQRVKSLESLEDSIKEIEPRLKQTTCGVKNVEAILRFTARIHPADKAPEFMNAFTQAGVTSVNLYGYDFSDYDAVYQKAAEQAVKNARTKARLIAERSGTKLKKVKSFSFSQPTRFGRFGPQSKTVVSQPRYVNYVTIPPVYETVTEPVVIQEASTELVTIPATYETVSETFVVQEASTELVTIPATYETVTETVVVQPQSVTYGPGGQQQVIPAVTKQVNRRVVKTPARVTERVIPAVTQQIQRRVVKTPASTQEKVVPAVIKMETRRVIKTPASTIEQVTPGQTQTVFNGAQADQNNALRRSVLSGPQKVEVSAHLVFDYATALDDVRIVN